MAVELNWMSEWMNEGECDEGMLLATAANASGYS